MNNQHLTSSELEEFLELEASGSTNESPSAASIVAHVRACPTCAAFMERYRDVDRKIQSVRNFSTRVDQAQCLSEDALLELATGIAPAKEALKLLDHCSACERCAQRLRLVQQDLAIEQAETPGVESGSDEWQLRIAQQMAAQASLASASRKLRRMAIVALAAAMAVVLAAVWLFRSRSAGAHSMLARLYTEDRTLALRFPGAGYAELHQHRSGSQDSLFDRNPLIQKSEEAILGVCKPAPKASRCLLLKAQLDLLDWHPDPALKTLALVKRDALSPSESQEFLQTRAIALFEQAEDSGEDKDLYGRAIADLSDLLREDHNNPVALFNRALLYEKLGWLENASADWLAFLHTEQDPGWKAEAQEHLDQIQQKKNPGP